MACGILKKTREGDMAVEWGGMIAGGVAAGLILIYLISRFYIVRDDRTFMTHDEKDFRRALRGWGIRWWPLETIVKGPSVSALAFPSFSASENKIVMRELRTRKTGEVNLRPHFCVPPPFTAVTADNHQLTIHARVQFSLNRDRMRFIYRIDDFGDVLVSRIQDAFRAEIGAREDEIVRAQVGLVNEGVIQRLRDADLEGDEKGEEGMTLGVVFHRAGFEFRTPSQTSELDAALMRASAAGGAGPDTALTQTAIIDAARLQMRRGAASIKPQEIDSLADVFVHQTPESTRAVLALIEMQTRQNIAEALAASGNVVVVTGQELGLTGQATQADAVRDAMLRQRGEESAPVSPPAPKPKD
jgi:hypothetical protein